LIVSVGIALAPPTPDASSLSAPASEAGGDGDGVNWAAEAHRAVKAFEIRRDQHVGHAFGPSAEDVAPPPQKHRAGDRSRTDNGDWIVWIDAACYQVATWHAGAPTQDSTPPRTICTDDDRVPHQAPLSAQ
jgi:hypothetical protein